MEGCDIELGMRVKFIVGLDKKQRLRALKITPSKSKRGGGGVGPNKRRKVEKREGEKSLDEVEGLTLDGEVISWKSPWGWVRGEGFEEDVFAHKDDVATGQELKVGQ